MKDASNIIANIEELHGDQTIADQSLQTPSFLHMSN